jgi:hypothetical protein
VRPQPVVKLLLVYRAGDFALMNPAEPGLHAGALGGEPYVYGDVFPLAAMLAKFQDLVAQ